MLKELVALAVATLLARLLARIAYHALRQTSFCHSNETGCGPPLPLSGVLGDAGVRF